VPKRGHRKSMRIATRPSKVPAPPVYMDITCEEEEEEEDTGTTPFPQEKKELPKVLRTKSPVPKKPASVSFPKGTGTIPVPQAVSAKVPGGFAGFAGSYGFGTPPISAAKFQELQDSLSHMLKGPEDKDTEDALALIRKAAKESDAGEPIAVPADFFRENIEEITEKQLRMTFEINFFACFFLAKHSLKHMKEGSSIINTISALAYIGEPTWLDYSCTKGAILTFTRSLGLQLIKRGIRVNGVSPGPTWTPLPVASLPVERIVNYGSGTPMKRAGQPFELAPSYVFLASNDCSSYFTGQVLHPNGGVIVNA
ncbi:hypothetical protein SOVF_150000, partial [Spinacia oleracea]